MCVFLNVFLLSFIAYCFHICIDLFYYLLGCTLKHLLFFLLIFITVSVELRRQIFFINGTISASYCLPPFFCFECVYLFRPSISDQFINCNSLSFLFCIFSLKCFFPHLFICIVVLLRRIEMASILYKRSSGPLANLPAS